MKVNYSNGLQARPYDGPRIDWYRAADRLVPGRGSIGTGPRIDWYRAAKLQNTYWSWHHSLSGHVIGRFFSCKHYCMHRVRAQKHKVSIGDGAEL